MGEYAIRRVLLFIPTLLVATVLVFTLFWIGPGDPALTILAGGEGDSGAVSPAQLQQLRQTLGLDRPIYAQYASWLGHVLRGDLGTSLWYKTPVWDQLKDRFLVTMELAGMAILLAFLPAVPLWIMSPREPGHQVRLSQPHLLQHRHCPADVLVGRPDRLRPRNPVPVVTSPRLCHAVG